MNKAVFRKGMCCLIAAVMMLAFTAYGYQSPEPTEKQLELLESQMLELTGVKNARQLGGYVTEDGRTVKENVLIRSGALASATQEDLEILSEKYNVKLVIDFRNATDAGRSPDPQFNDAVFVTVPVWDENINNVTMADFMKLMQEFGNEPGRSDLEAVRRGYMGTDPDLYIKQTFQNDISLAGFRQFFDLLLAQEEDTGIIFHCSSGKDRTGSAAVLLLTLLGVDRETIIEDYALTNVVLKDSLDEKVAQSAQYTDDDAELEAVFTTNGVNPSWMERTFDYAEEQSGSMLEYIKEVFNVTDEEIEILRDKYLTDGEEAATEEPEGTRFSVVDPETQSLNLPSIPNARQLGGYVTEDGRKVRQNVLLRTGWLTEATDEDIAALADVYHVTTIVDFRGEMELTRTPDREVPGAEYVNISMEDKDKQADAMADMAKMAQIEMQYADQPGRAMIELIRLGYRAPVKDMYITSVTSESTVPAFRAFFDLLLNQDENSVILYHCKGGKDRTGIATMYILTMLGVDKETILEDFDMTNIYLADEINAEVEKSRPYAANEEELNDVAVNNGVSREFLERAYDYAEKEYGSMLELIKQRYGVTDEEIETLRNLYLTD